MLNINIFIGIRLEILILRGIELNLIKLIGHFSNKSDFVVTYFMFLNFICFGKNINFRFLKQIPFIIPCSSYILALSVTFVLSYKVNKASFNIIFNFRTFVYTKIIEVFVLIKFKIVIKTDKILPNFTNFNIISWSLLHLKPY